MQTERHTQPRPLTAVLKKEFDADYCRGGTDFTNTTDATLTLQPGVLLTGDNRDAVFDTATPAAVTGVCITAIELRPGETHPIAFLDSGPGILLRSGLELPADATQADAIIAALEAKSWKIVNGINS